jgi:GNAT superfamily N-acetyltransferase
VTEHATFSIRAAGAPDARSIGRLQTHGWQLGFREFMSDKVRARQSIEGFERMILDRLASGRNDAGTLVAVDCNGTVIGFCAVNSVFAFEPPEPNTGQIADLYVDSSSWGSGVGTALLLEAFALLRAKGREEVALWTFESNRRANRFYTHHGFEPGTEKIIHGPSGEAMVLMRRSLVGSTTS